MAKSSLLFIGATVLASSFFCGAIKAGSEDERTPLALTPPEKAYVLGQMRLFVESIEAIASGLANPDHTAAIEAAAARGQKRNQNDPAFPASLGAKLPAEWKQFGGSTRKGFDTLSTEIASAKDINQPLKTLGDVMKNCVGCHATYHITDAPL